MTLCDWCDKKAKYRIEYETIITHQVWTDYACEEHYMKYWFNDPKPKLVSTLEIIEEEAKQK